MAYFDQFHSRLQTTRIMTSRVNHLSHGANRQLMIVHEVLGGDTVWTPNLSLVIHRSQLEWRVSSLGSWVLDKAHDSAAP